MTDTLNIGAFTPGIYSSPYMFDDIDIMQRAYLSFITNLSVAIKRAMPSSKLSPFGICP